MRRIADAVTAIVEGNPTLQLGMRNRILNLSQVAKFIQPLVAARVKKEVQPAALTMALSRMQRSLTKVQRLAKEVPFQLDSLSIHSGLAVITYSNTQRLRQIVNGLVNRLQKREIYITVTEGVRQLTVLVDTREIAGLREAIEEKPLRVQEKVAALAVNFHSDYTESPGFFFTIFQKLYLQNVNIVEIASTSNELIIYLEERDVELAFDTLYRQFVRR
jgi:aspartokinase